MDVPNIYTITIVRNLGMPISFTVKRWKVWFFLWTLLLLATYVGYETFQYLHLKEENNELQKTLSESQKKIKLLTNRIEKYDNALFQGQAPVKKMPSVLEATLLKQIEIENDGIWITEKSHSLTQDLQEEATLEVTKLTSRMKGDDLLMSVEISNTSKEPKDVGGYLSIALVNNDNSPPIYKSATGGSLGDNGFPSTYKSDRPFLIKGKHRTRTYRINRVRLTQTNEYYTDALLLIYSYKGRLLNKQSIPLDRKIFLEP